MHSNFPSGIVTFLFTDIEGSTRLWHEYPEAMAIAHSRHDEILRSAFESHGGVIFNYSGDSFNAAFHTATDGFLAAFTAQLNLQSQAWDKIGDLRVRMGLHTGEAEVIFKAEKKDYAGYSTLATVQRLMSVAHGGQVLLSQTTFDLLQNLRFDSMSFLDLGKHRLKDIHSVFHIYQLVAPNLIKEFPPIKTIDSFPTNISTQLSSFIGREKEIIEVITLLETFRLVTLSGPGGIGKTRLSQEIGIQKLGMFKHGVWFIEMNSLRHGAQIVLAVAQIFGLKEMPSLSLNKIVVEFLRDKQILLIFDNCEHLIDDFVYLAEELIRHCNGVKILATSRESIGIDGEKLYSVSPLSIPSHLSLSFEELLNFQAIRLFEQRAKLIDPKFRLTENNSFAVAQICNRLDGIPLAIELAASRIRLFSANQIAERLDDCFQLLVGGKRDTSPHHQTLRALIDWSYELLSKDERKLFHQLSIFEGSWSIEAAEAINKNLDAPNLLESLIKKSLVVVEEINGDNHYRYLGTIRQFAYQKLLESGEFDTVRELFLNFYSSLIAVAENELQGRGMVEWLDKLLIELENIRTALSWAVDLDPIKSLSLVAALCHFWSRRASATEGLEWIQITMQRAEASVENPIPADQNYTETRAKILAARATLAFDRGDSSFSLVSAKESINLARNVGAMKILAWSLSIGAKVLYLLGDQVLAHTWAKEAYLLSQKYSFLFELGLALSAMQMTVDLADLSEMEMFRTESMPIIRRLGNPWVLSLNILDAAVLAAKRGDVNESLHDFEEAAALFKKMGDRQYYLASRSQLAHVLRHHQRYTEAKSLYFETAKLWKEIGHYSALAHELECLGFIEIKEGNFKRATKLFGAAERFRQESDTPMSLNERVEYGYMLDVLQSNIGDQELGELWSIGKSLTGEQVIALLIGMNIDN